jgi:hypothetical protein
LHLENEDLYALPAGHAQEDPRMLDLVSRQRAALGHRLQDRDIGRIQR